MAFSGSASYYLHKGVTGSGSGTQTGVLSSPPGFRPLSNPGFSFHSSGAATGFSFQSSGRGTPGSGLATEPSQANFSYGIKIGEPRSGVPTGEPIKKKRGRPRKYGPEGAVSLALSPISATSLPGSLTPTQKRSRGRPPGTGRKQRLANLGEWMTSSAGQAFAPHVISIEVGEDIASKILLFSQQRPRAVCIMSANGTVSAVTLRQPVSSDSTITYEGRFEILCLSGSYLLDEEGGPHKRIGGLNVSLSTPDGQVIGGGVGGNLIASSLVQVVACSFIYGGSKIKNKTEIAPKIEGRGSDVQAGGTQTSAAPTQNLAPTSAMGNWSRSEPLDLRNEHLGIDLMHG